MLVNGSPAKAGSKLKPGDTVTVCMEEGKETRVEPEEIPIEIVYEDEHFAVVNKTTGHGGASRAGEFHRNYGGRFAVQAE